ncbi:MAG: hypothetical protein ACO3RB_03675 [Ilumatobacteraceae bacterium]
MDRLGRLQHPLENLAQALDGVARCREVTSGIVYGALQDVQTILEFVELDTRDDEFVL